MPHEQKKIVLNERIHINNTRQWVALNGRDARNPILLWLDDGPGLNLAHKRAVLNQELLDHFSIVNWHQRGYGRSHRAVASWPDVKLSDYVDDVLDLAELLAHRFSLPRIYLLGHGWGSVIGLWAAEKNPGLFYAYVGLSQWSALPENARYVHGQASTLAERCCSPWSIWQLGRIRKTPWSVLSGDDFRILYSCIRRESVLREGLAPRLGSFRHLSPLDIYNSWRDVRRGFRFLYPQLLLPGLPEVTSVAVPVYFLMGRYDKTFSPHLAEQFFDALQAPAKTFIWFERSGLSPAYEEPARFNRILIERIKRETFPGA